jgi:hypothetical protein
VNSRLRQGKGKLEALYYRHLLSHSIPVKSPNEPESAFMSVLSLQALKPSNKSQTKNPRLGLGLSGRALSEALGSITSTRGGGGAYLFNL